MGVEKSVFPAMLKNMRFLGMISISSHILHGVLLPSIFGPDPTLEAHIIETEGDRRCARQFRKGEAGLSEAY